MATALSKLSQNFGTIYYVFAYVLKLWYIFLCFGTLSQLFAISSKLLAHLLFGTLSEHVAH